MSVKLLYFCVCSFLLVGVAIADSTKATNEQPSLNTNPQIELWPGQSEQFLALIESARVAQVTHLLEILNNLRNGENEKAIKMLEADLEAESKLLVTQKNKSKEAKDIMKQVAKYNNRFKEKSAPNKAPQPTQ